MRESFPLDKLQFLLHLKHYFRFEATKTDNIKILGDNHGRLILGMHAMDYQNIERHIVIKLQPVGEERSAKANEKKMMQLLDFNNHMFYKGSPYIRIMMPWNTNQHLSNKFTIYEDPNTLQRYAMFVMPFEQGKHAPLKHLTTKFSHKLGQVIAKSHRNSETIKEIDFKPQEYDTNGHFDADIWSINRLGEVLDTLLILDDYHQAVYQDIELMCDAIQRYSQPYNQMFQLFEQRNQPIYETRVHGDLNSKNILITRDTQIRLLDPMDLKRHRGYDLINFLLQGNAMDPDFFHSIDKPLKPYCNRRNISKVLHGYESIYPFSKTEKLWAQLEVLSRCLEIASKEVGYALVEYEKTVPRIDFIQRQKHKVIYALSAGTQMQKILTNHWQYANQERLTQSRHTPSKIWGSPTQTKLNRRRHAKQVRGGR